ncbi:hypothetical protein CDCA_CDCA11G3164 [Cyanidium caldarium]|uniref:Uncharacterized protein n=1 Tax=Cyanidium caldarium TaxID=2771 RepID=A0AAV9IYF8_CYACA|nr:hypothetical protein CDCA_CDCA11G3164 [Cyanidium caldarium]
MRYQEEEQVDVHREQGLQSDAQETHRFYARLREGLDKERAELRQWRVQLEADVAQLERQLRQVQAEVVRRLEGHHESEKEEEEAAGNEKGE